MSKQAVNKIVSVLPQSDSKQAVNKAVNVLPFAGQPTFSIPTSAIKAPVKKINK